MVKLRRVKYIRTVLVICLAVSNATATLGMRLPRLETRALDGRPLVLPDSAAGSIALVGFGYQRDSQEDLDSWLVPFRQEYVSGDGFRAYEVPMMGPRIPGLLRGIINRAMRNALAKENRRWVAPFYGDIDSYSARLGVGDRSRVHIYLLDGSGVIRWQAAGRADSAGLASLRLEVARLAAGGGE